MRHRNNQTKKSQRVNYGKPFHTIITLDELAVYVSTFIGKDCLQSVFSPKLRDVQCPALPH
jgi:hypothetical protein